MVGKRNFSVKKEICKFSVLNNWMKLVEESEVDETKLHEQFIH